MYRLYRGVLWVQGIYTSITALWAIVDIDSFQKVTGPKTDIWLVKTVSAILLSIGLTFIAFALQKKKNIAATVLGISSSIALSFIDFYFAGNNVIRNIYMGDGVMQLIFLSCWAFLLSKWKSLIVNEF